MGILRLVFPVRGFMELASGRAILSLYSLVFDRKIRRHMIHAFLYYMAHLISFDVRA